MRLFIVAVTLSLTLTFLIAGVPGAGTLADAQENCHPSYEGACLDASLSDYDCYGGEGNGPGYTGEVTVVGPDKYDLDNDDDGIGCDGVSMPAATEAATATSTPEVEASPTGVSTAPPTQSAPQATLTATTAAAVAPKAGSGPASWNGNDPMPWLVAGLAGAGIAWLIAGVSGAAVRVAARGAKGDDARRPAPHHFVPTMRPTRRSDDKRGSVDK